MLGLSTRGKSREEMCDAIDRVVNRSHFGDLINKIQRRDSRIRDGRRRSAEKLARGEELFGGYRRPARKSIVEWSSYSPSVSQELAIPEAPPAPATSEPGILERLFGSAPPAPPPVAPAPPAAVSFSFLSSSIPEAPPSPSVSYSMPSMSSSFNDSEVDYVEYDPEYMDVDEDFEDYYEYDDEPYSMSLSAPTVSAASPTVAEIVARLTGNVPAAPPAPKKPAKKKAEFVDELDAIQDFIRAYSKKEYADDAARAAAMTRDIRGTSNVTKDYDAWKNAPWDYDWEGIDTEGSAEDFMGNMRSGGFYRDLGKQQRSKYL